MQRRLAQICDELGGGLDHAVVPADVLVGVLPAVLVHRDQVGDTAAALFLACRLFQRQIDVVVVAALGRFPVFTRRVRGVIVVGGGVRVVVGERRGGGGLVLGGVEVVEILSARKEIGK